jgi:hypothetical protein
MPCGSEIAPDQALAEQLRGAVCPPPVLLLGVAQEPGQLLSEPEHFNQGWVTDGLRAGGGKRLEEACGATHTR